MLSKIEGRNYVFLLDGDRFPVKVNRKVMDRALLDIEVSFKKVQLLLKKLYETDYAAYAFIRDMVLGNDSRFDLDDGSSFLIDQVVDNAVSVHERLLTGNDEIKSQEEIETLEDLGYHWYGGGLAHVMYEKVLEDSDEKEVVEEIQQSGDKMVRRIRTTLWKKTNFGKSSVSITYKKIGNTKRLVKAFFNSKAEKHF